MRPRRLTIAIGALALLGAAPAPVPAPAPPRRIVSLGLCADQLLVALADRKQIAAITRWGSDPRLSAVAAEARGLPVTQRSAEEIAALRPDLVLGAPFRTRAALTALGVRGVALLDVPPANDVAAIERSIALVAGAVGHPDRGVRLIAGMRRDLARIGPPPGRGRVAADYQRQGYLTGAGTLVDDMMRRVGLVNLATRLGRPVLSTVSLEEMALARPEFLVSGSGEPAADRGAAMLRHPLLAAAVPAGRRLRIPSALIECGGPAYPRAVALLAAQIRAADARQNRPRKPA